MKNDKLKKMILCAMFTALTCLATFIIQIPSPMNGYVNAGDSLVLLSAWMLGPFYGAFAAGVGSCMADIFAGYIIYAPATFIIKGLMALCAWGIYKILIKKYSKEIFSYLVSAVLAELIMISGYFLFAFLIMGKGFAAALSIPGNCVQGLFGIVSAILIKKVLNKYMEKQR